MTGEKAGLWTDARYHLRAEQELEGSGIELFRMGLPNVLGYRKWLQEQPSGGACERGHGIKTGPGSPGPVSYFRSLGFFVLAVGALLFSDDPFRNVCGDHFVVIELHIEDPTPSCNGP